MQYDIKIRKLLWENARIAKELNPNLFRIDACGALIMWDKYNMVNPFGWEVDYIFPQSLGGKDDIENLRVLHYKNNESKSDDYPSDVAYIRFNGKNNVKDVRSLKVNCKGKRKIESIV